VKALGRHGTKRGLAGQREKKVRKKSSIKHLGGEYHEENVGLLDGGAS